MAESIAVIGGSGSLGAGLAMRWARAGHDVVIGSRVPDRAADAAARLNRQAGTDTIRGTGNPEAAAAAGIVALTVPFANHAATLEVLRPVLAGRILIDTTVPLVPPRVRTVRIPEGGSCARHAQDVLGAEVRVVSAFQNVAADHLADLAHEIDCDVLVCGNDPAAREIVVGLAADAGLRAWHAGVIANSIVAEALTSALIFMNARYRIDGAGVRITGTPGSAGR